MHCAADISGCGPAVFFEPCLDSRLHASQVLYRTEALAAPGSGKGAPCRAVATSSHALKQTGRPSLASFTEAGAEVGICLRSTHDC